MKLKMCSQEGIFFGIMCGFRRAWV